MTHIKSFFGSRLRSVQTVTHEKTTGHIAKRTFFIGIEAIDGEDVTLSVAYEDSDRLGRKLPTGRKRCGTQTLSVEDFANPMELLERAAQEATPDFFASGRGRRDTAGVGGAGPGSAGPAGRNEGPALAAPSSTAEMLRALQRGEGLGRGEVAPRPESVERFQSFCAKLQGVLPPQLASTAQGELRARWTDGPKRHVTVTFPLSGPLVVSAAWGRHGDYGLAQARCYISEERDVASFIAMMGVPLTARR